MNEYNVSRIELSDETLDRVAGGLAPSQLDRRKDGAEALIPRSERIDKLPQAYLFWTHWVPHVPRA